MLTKSNNSFTYANRTIQYHIEKSFRRSLSIHIKPDATVLVRAPKFFPNFMIQKQVEERATWIYKKLIEIEKHTKKIVPKKYKDGEVHYLLGKEYTLKSQTGEIDEVSIQGEYIIITSKRISSVIIKSLLTAWYHEQSIQILYKQYELACAVFAEIGIIPQSLTYKPMRGKWGYCSHDNHICLNPELVKTPLVCIEYVIYHELCHVRHHNHGVRFHALQRKMLPDYKIRKKKLDTFSS